MPLIKFKTNIIMRKLRFLFVLLAMVSLASCEFKDENVIRYEINAENPAESYVIELNTSETCSGWNPRLLTDTITLPSGARTGMICRTLVHCYLGLSPDVMYETIPADEYCTMKVIYPEEKVSDKKLFYDFIKNAGINSDTIYKPSYKLIVVDNERFNKYKTDDTFVRVGCGPAKNQKDSYDFCCNLGYDKKSVDKNHRITDILHLIHNLRTFYHIPAFVDDTFTLNIHESFTIEKDFYSEHKSVEEINEMLSEYGLSLEPTGEDMMVITLSVDEPIKAPEFFESKSYTSKFFIILLLCVFACVLAVVGISKKETLQPKNKSALRVVLSVLIWIVASVFLLIFLLMFTDIMQQTLLKSSGFTVKLNNSVSLCALSWTLIFVAFGISIFNYRKTYCGTSTEIPRVFFSIVIFMLMFKISKSIISGFASINQWSFWLYIVSAILFIISIRAAKMKTESDAEIIKPEEENKTNNK